MKTLSTEELKTILENHKYWLNDAGKGREDMRADLSNADLSNADLRDANLNYAILSNADLSNADLRYAILSNADLRDANLSNADLDSADLSYANLSNANLSNADLSYADLSNADLSYTDLSNADLSNADLNDADLSNANLRGADLKGVDLSFTNFSYADLSYADLSYANLSSAILLAADLRGAKNLPYIPIACPEDGAFIGWKKAKTKRSYVIVKLEIPASAKRSSATTRKCRCDKAKVLEIYNLDGAVSEERKCYSSYDDSFIYEVGKTVKVDDFDEDRWNECSQGIHFFINRQEAVDY